MKINNLIIWIIVMGMTQFNCGSGGGHQHGHNHPGQANQHMHKSDFKDLVARFEGKERATWQKPTECVELMGDLNGKTIMDIGSGTGYFSFPLVEAGAKVIAADVDEKFLDYLKKRKDSASLSDELLELRKIPYDNPSLKESEVDMVLIVNTYHHVEDRIPYFKSVVKGLKPGGTLWVIDFKKEDTPHGPPKNLRISASEIRAELNQSGFSTFSVNDSLLPYQFILTAGID